MSSIIECERCQMMTGHPVSTYMTPVVCFSSPDGSRTEYTTEYNCSNCFYSFIKVQPSQEIIISAPQYQTDSILPLQFDTSSSTRPRIIRGTGYTNRARFRIGHTNNRRRKTAALKDIKSTKKTTQSDESCEITEIDLEI
jgi:hypothetical protein